MSGIHDFTAKSLAGEDIPLKRFEGQVLLIVNTASACGFTPQYRGLEALHQELAPRGFSVLGFPCNQFGGQEPGDARQIEQFCSTNYAVTFPMFAKIDVNGSNAHPLYQYLKNAEIRIARLVDQMEFYQIPDRPVGQGGCAACADGEAGRIDKGNRGIAVNDKTDATTDQLPDRLSTDPKSPYYNADVLARDVGIRFKGIEKTNVEEYCVSEGWVRVTAGAARDRYGNPLTIKVHGPVEPYFRDKA